MASTRPNLASRFSSDETAIAAVEFAMVSPVLFLVMAGVFELSRAADTARRLTSVADTAATMLASAPPPSANPTTTIYVHYTDLHYANDATMLIFPGVLSDSAAKSIPWNKDITISMAGIRFAPTGCTTTCTAQVDWTGDAQQRTCGSTLTPAPDNSTPSPVKLPADLYDVVTTPNGTAGPQYAIVVDVTYTWTPIIFSRFFGPLTVTRSAYVTPRYATYVKYQTIANDDGFGKACP